MAGCPSFTVERVARRPARRLAAALAAVGLVAVLTAATASAQTRITLGGAGPLYLPGGIAGLPLGRLLLIGTDYGDGPPLSLLDGYNTLNRAIGENWFPRSAPQVVLYPASSGIMSGSRAAPPVNQAVAVGQESLGARIRTAATGGEPVVIAGLSQGTLVINRVLADLANDPANAPPSDRLSFALFSGPETGLFNVYLPPKWTVPLVNYTVHTGPSDSQYDVDVVYRQYDGWADPPDRPWNLLAVANAVAGTVYFHHGAALAHPRDAVEINRVTGSLGGTTTTYMIPSPTLPLLLPLRELGVPSRVVDSLNAALKPVVDAGYSRLTPDAGPYFSHGRLVESSAASPAGSPPATPAARGAPQSVSPSPSRATRSPIAARTPGPDRIRARIDRN